MQLELFEVMYRCAKPLGDRVYHNHLDAQVCACVASCLDWLPATPRDTLGVCLLTRL